MELFYEMLKAVFENAAIAGVPLLLFVFGFTQWLKGTFTLAGRAVRIASMAVGVFFGVGYQLTVATPATIGAWFGVLVFGIGLGLVASGAYDAADQIANKK